MAKKSEVSQGTQDARKRSEETLKEQEGMRPVPSQEDADRIRLGERVDADEDQPEGPAKRTAEETAAANEESLRRTSTPSSDQGATYKTRDTSGSAPKK